MIDALSRRSGPPGPTLGIPAFLSTRLARVPVVLVLLASAVLVLGIAGAIELTSSGGHQTRPFDDRASGITGRRPASWALSDDAAGLSLTSPDRTTLIEIAAPGPASAADNLLAGTITAIGHGYDDVALQARTSRRIGQLTAQVAVLSARNRKGVPLRILVAAAPGHALAYLVEVFTATSSPPSTVLAAQSVIDSLQLTR